MNETIAIADIQPVLRRERLLPTVVMWNRLEGRPRREDFLRALRAEVRDPLWMLCKQWQVGEFRGDDAGSPVFAKVSMSTTRIDTYRPGAAASRPFDDAVALETTVEQRPVPFTAGDRPLSLDVRLAMGRQWVKLLASAGHAALKPLFIAAYGIEDPDPTARPDAPLTAHPGVWQTFSALAGRAMDGARLYAHLAADPAHRPYDGMAGVPDGAKADLDGLAERFVRWYEDLFRQPAGGDDAWMPSRLEYRFAVSAPKRGAEKVLTADEYYQGRLDWYSLDVDPGIDGLGGGDGDAEGGEPGDGEPGDGEPPETGPEEVVTLSFFPTALRFEGMPNTRWWTFEDGKTNFGDVKPDTTDLDKLLLMEFALVYANDWFLVPFQLPVGSLAQVDGLAVTNVFGERTWVRASGSGEDDEWQRWAMYNLSVKGEGRAADTTLVLLPTVPKIQQGAPFDDVRLVRDEVANMVWGVESAIPLATGDPKAGAVAATQLAARYRRILDGEIEGGLPVPEPLEPAAPIRYRLMNSVPENWIPFLPVHVEGDVREIQLQRASMPRLLEGDPNPPQKIKPRTVLLRDGLDETPARAYFLCEEEVLRTGVRVTQSYQRTRWHDGSVFTWIGVRKETGRGEGRSGLAFDRLETTRRRRRAVRR